jgi:hypothetical protein
MPQHRRICTAGVALLLALAFTVFRPPSTPGPLERDFEAYYAAGAIANVGADPYSRAIWEAEARVPGVNATRDELLPFVGPAAMLPLWSLLARLPYRGALAIWTALLVLAAGTILVCGLCLSGARGDPWLYLLAGAFVLASAPLIASLALGQAALISAASVAAAIVTYRVRWPAAAFVATFGTAIQPNLTFALLARIRSWWDAAVAACAGLAFAIITLTVGGGIHGFTVYLQRLGAHGAAERIAAIQHTPTAIAYALGVPAQLAAVCGAVVAFAAVIAAITIVVRERLDATDATLVASALLPLAIPFFHEHDFVLELLAILVLAERTQGRARRLGAVAAVLVLIDWFGLAQRQGAQGQIICLGAAVAVAFIGLGRAALAVLAGLAALALPLAASHGAPTWPDALPAQYHAKPGDDASAAWADESRVTGLLGRDPVWGVLRTLPLAGCVVLAGAIVADARRRRGACLAASFPPVTRPSAPGVHA